MQQTRKVKIFHYPAESNVDLPPLLFVHGGYAHSQYWAVNFIPFFQAQGYDCYALDLSGHGQSDGVAQLDSFGLDDFADDVALAIQALPHVPVVVAHSMGCAVTQRLLYRASNTIKASVFIAPVPPSGTGLSALRLAVIVPDFFSELNHFFEGSEPTERTLDIIAQIYFSPDTPRRVLLDTLPMVQTESNRAIAELATSPLPFGMRTPTLPVLFMGGTNDAIFLSSALPITAMSWNAKTVLIQGAGHMLMLDPQWEEAAHAIQSWIQALPA